MLGSFKLKLVGTFLALSVLPLAAAFWGFSQVAERSVTSSTDDRLEAGLSAALVAFEDERQRAGSAAERLGGDPEFQAAVSSDDRAAIAGCFRRRPPCGWRCRARPPSASVPVLAAETDVSLLGPGADSRHDRRRGTADRERWRGGCTLGRAWRRRISSQSFAPTAASPRRPIRRWQVTRSSSPEESRR